MIAGAIILGNVIMEESSNNGQFKKAIDLLEGEQQLYQRDVTNSLIDSINQSSHAKLINNMLTLKKGQLFSSTNYQSKIITNFWTGKQLNLSLPQIDEIIKLLNDNFSVLLQELTKQIEELRSLFGNHILDLELILKQHQLQGQIVQQSQVLKSLLEKAEKDLLSRRLDKSKEWKKVESKRRNNLLNDYLSSNKIIQVEEVETLKRKLSEPKFHELANVKQKLTTFKEQFRQTIEGSEQQLQLQSQEVEIPANK